MKKQLLNESEIRKMMKFANIGALSDPFVDKLSESAMYDEDEHMEEEEGDEEEPSELPMGAEPDLPPEPEPDMGDDEPDMGDMGDMDDMGAAAGGTTVEAGLEGLNAFLEAAMEHPDEVREKVQVEMADDTGAMGDPADDPMGDPMELPGPDGEDGDVAMDPAADDDSLEDELEEADLQLQEDDVFVNEVVRRVAKRLLKK